MPSLRKILLASLFVIFLTPATATARGYYRSYRGHSRGFYGNTYRSWYPRSYFYGGFSYYRPYYYYYSPPVVVIEREREVVRERDYDRRDDRPARGRDAYGRRY